ncbi:MAG: peptidylprolyl isomerase [Bacteroidales bacterium]|nr:peptidylprolyl isomerase [Bacteroidales bacterium]
MKSLRMIFGLLMIISAGILVAQNNVAEEVAWVVGDKPIWKSEIEEQYNSMQYERMTIDGDPYCVIPELLAIEKLYLHQADLDTIEANENAVMSEVDARINYYISSLGSKEKMEEYFRKPMAEMRQTITESVRNNYRVQQVQNELTKNVKVTPSDVRRYFNSLSEDSVPYVPLMVETQIITINPIIPRQEIEDVKARLRSYADQVTRGEAEFSTLAILYSEDGSAVMGGELGLTGRARLDPEFAAVAFNLNDPKKVSKIVETDAGYHIIQLIEKRGDRINCRHILLKPHVSENDLQEATVRLDSLRHMIVNGEMKFEEAVPYVSQDKDTRNNRGVMVNAETGNTRFQMDQLPQEVAIAIDKLEVGEISEPFTMINPSTNREVVALVKLTSRTPGHKANLSDDFTQIKEMCEATTKQKILDDWLRKKIQETYVRIEEGWRNCEFHHQGWIKERTMAD